jgi:hypothetical protein
VAEALERADHPARATLRAALRRTRLGRVLWDALGARGPADASSWERVRPRSVTARVRDGILARYRGEVEAIARSCAAAGVPLLLATAVSNGREVPPGQSAFSRELPDAERERFVALLDGAAEQTRAGELEAAAASLDLARAIDPAVAELLHLEARLAWSRGDEAEARRLDHEAWGLDEYGRGASTAVHRIVAETAAAHEAVGARRVELRPVLERPPQPGEPRIFVDYCHPTAYGQYLVARELAKALADTPPFAERRRAGVPPGDAAFPSFAEACQQLGLPPAAELVGTSEQLRAAGYVLSALSSASDQPLKSARAILATVDFATVKEPVLVASDLVVALFDEDGPRARERAARLRALDPVLLRRTAAAIEQHPLLGDRSKTLGVDLSARGP